MSIQETAPAPSKTNEERARDAAWDVGKNVTTALVIYLGAAMFGVVRTHKAEVAVASAALTLMVALVWSGVVRDIWAGVRAVVRAGGVLAILRNSVLVVLGWGVFFLVLQALFGSLAGLADNEKHTCSDGTIVRGSQCP